MQAGGRRFDPDYLHHLTKWTLKVEEESEPSKAKARDPIQHRIGTREVVLVRKRRGKGAGMAFGEGQSLTTKAEQKRTFLGDGPIAQLARAHD